MKVLLPKGRELKGFERQLQTTLEQANLEGYALMGFSFCEAQGCIQHEIDALVLVEPATFVCLEAKGYSGRWTGGANETWKCNDREIQSVGENPYKQVFKYSCVIKNRLNQQVFNDVQDVNFFVNAFVVAPDGVKIEVEGAVIDQFNLGNSVFICHRSRLENVISSIWTTGSGSVVETVKKVGLKQIISQLTGVSVDKLDALITPGSQPKNKRAKPKKTMPLPIPPVPEPSPPKAFPSTAIGLVCIAGILAAAAAAAAAVTAFFWSNRPCEVSTETRTNNTCYKDLTRTPLRIGVLTAPDQYTEFKSYLEKQLGSKASGVIIKGNSSIAYIEAQNQIAKQEWDVVFALSPMNGMRAKDNGYTWAAKMFPDFPPVYQAALFVRADSSIQSVDDIVSSTMIALGDFSSVSSFYMPTYDLYGKSASVTVGHRSSKIKELVARRQAGVGTAVYSSVKDDSKFRVIHVSREIPGAGVYLSPKLSPTDQGKIDQLLIDAPEEIKKQANYGKGSEPDYEVFRTISVRADEVMACANFNRNPVQFFCNEPHQGIIGKLSGFTNQTNGMIRFRLEQENSKICNVIVPLQTLSGVPNGTSPGILNGKRVNIIGVQPKESKEGNCELAITNSKQLVVLQK